MTDPKPELTPVPEYEESIEPPLSELDQAELDALDAEPPTYHTLLQVFRTVLEPAREDQTQRVGPGWASRITQTFPKIELQDMNRFRDLYFAKVLEMLDILEYIISTDDQALGRLDIESDREGNWHHYRNLLELWQAQIVTWEKNWNCEDPDAAIELGAISEVHRMFFGAEGLTAFLDNIGFQLTEADQTEMAEVLNEIKAGDHE